MVNYPLVPLFSILYILVISYFFGFKGGVFSSLWSSLLLIYITTTRTGLEFSTMPVTIITFYFIIGLVLGRGIDFFKKLTEKFRSLHEAALRLGRAETEKEVCEITVKASEDILDFNKAILLMKEDDLLRVKAFSSSIDISEEENFSPAEGIAGRTYQEQESFNIEDIRDSKEAAPYSEDYVSGISIPIGEMGVFQAMSRQKNYFDDQDVRLAELLISHTRGTLNRLHYEKKIEYLSFRDALTGLYNRRYFEAEIEKLNNSRRQPIGIVVGDMDGLKRVNDNQGHQSGDLLVKQTAEVIKESVRQEDVAARIGGDEFGILLPEIDQENCLKVCSRIKSNIKKRNQKGDLPAPLSISLGYALNEDSSDDLMEIFERADRRMYNNKGQQRSFNR